jgi:hypothetical protein
LKLIKSQQIKEMPDKTKSNQIKLKINNKTIKNNKTPMQKLNFKFEITSNSNSTSQPHPHIYDCAEPSELVVAGVYAGGSGLQLVREGSRHAREKKRNATGNRSVDCTRKKIQIVRLKREEDKQRQLVKKTNKAIITTKPNFWQSNKTIISTTYQ